MAKENYFEILGLNRDAGDEDIRKAYKNLVLKYHPDRGSQCDSERFLKVQEAYATLCDPEKRQRYLRELEQTSTPVIPSSPHRAFREAVYPLSGFPDKSFSMDPFEQWLNRDIWGSLEKVSPTVEVILSPREARSGVRIPLEIPLQTPCAHCRGTGGFWFHPCSACGGKGIVLHERTITLEIPPGFRGDTRVNLTVGEAQGYTQDLMVVLRVRNHPAE
jgi:molecular chaperone DnaJ